MEHREGMLTPSCIWGRHLGEGGSQNISQTEKLCAHLPARQNMSTLILYTCSGLFVFLPHTHTATFVQRLGYTHTHTHTTCSFPQLHTHTCRLHTILPAFTGPLCRQWRRPGWRWSGWVGGGGVVFSPLFSLSLTAFSSASCRHLSLPSWW